MINVMIKTRRKKQEPVIVNPDSTTIGLMDLMNTLIRTLVKNDKEIYQLCYTTKGEDKSEFGYYHSNSGAILDLSKIVKTLKIKRVVDLGSGIGLSMAILKALNPELFVLGYENEPLLVRRAIIETEQRDILTLGKEDIKKSALYMWEPIREESKAKKFVENLVDITEQGQIIIYQRSGQIGYFLQKSEAFTRSPDLSYNSSSPFQVSGSRLEVYVRK